jgi:outer membrane protein TolC
MKAIVLLIVAISLYGMDYKSFKQKALQSSNMKKYSVITTDIAKKESKILTGSVDPTISLSGKHFEDDSGFSIGLNQSIKMVDYQNVADARLEEIGASELYKRALFIKELEIVYTDYIYQKRLGKLFEDELTLAKRLELISKNRVENGVGTKAQQLMATLASEDVQNKILAQQIKISESYYNLLRFSNIEQEIELNSKFIYPLSYKKTTIKINPKLLVASKLQDRLDKELQSKSSSLQTLNIFAEYEREPEQDIQSIGVEFDLPIFNNQRERFKLQSLELKKQKLKLKELQIKQRLKQKQLNKTLSSLKELYSSMKKREQKQQKLLKLFQEGYSISNGSLLEVLAVKDALIDQKRELLDIEKKINIKRIELNLMQGVYND